MVLGVQMTNSALVMNKAYTFGLIIGGSPSLDNYRYELKGYRPSYHINRKSMVSRFNPVAESKAAKILIDEVTPIQNALLDDSFSS